MTVHESPKIGSLKRRRKVLSPDEDFPTLEHLQDLLASVPLDDDVILLGDFNARTGFLNDMLSDANHLRQAAK